MDGFESSHWQQAFEVEIWGVELGALAPIEAPLLRSAGLLPIGSIASAHSRVALAFGAAAKAADKLEEEVGPGLDSELRDRLWELGGISIAARAALAALGADDQPLAAASIARGLVVEMREAISAGGLLECKVEVGAALIAHVGGFMGPLAVGGALIWDAACSQAHVGIPGDGRFQEGERLSIAALAGLGDHAVDAALRLGLLLRD